ncbi:MAG: hypothetical protein [Microvirus sp.]|nr:MAG: hypothetical protein [Microvirus sp.]
MRRHKMSGAHSRANFSHHAAHTHKRNMPRGRNHVMRGGIRL